MRHLTRDTRLWVALFAIILLLSAAVLLLRGGAASGTIAVIVRDGEELQRIDLSRVTQTYTLRLEYPDGGYNVIRVEPDKIGVIEASCPDQVCVGQGMIDGLTPIVCLPNRVMISVTSESEQPTADAIAR